jgi:uncharacterized protein (DUF488 family)
MGNIYTIGYGNIAVKNLLDLLKKYKVEILVDIRSRPYSRHRQEYRKRELEARIPDAGMGYIFLGDKLGGMPIDSRFYGPDGNIDYAMLSEDSNYLEGIHQVTELSHKKSVCLMCAEAEPERCHRGWLVSETLWKHGIESLHILHNSSILRHMDLRGKFAQIQRDLFDDVD